MGLSFIFLLLYVTASLRSGTTQFQNGSQLQKMAKENEELKNQVRVYESMRKDYLEQEANPDESKMYEELMSQLDLLQDKTKQERLELQAAANENAKKEKALNKYQQLVKSVIDTNLIAKSKIKKRENVIEEQDQEISDQNVQITELSSEIQDKKRELEEGQSRIKNIQSVLNSKVSQLKKAYESQKMSEENFKQQQAKLKQEADEKLEELRGHNAKIKSQLSNLDQQLGAAQQAIAAKEAELGVAEQNLNAAQKNLSAKEQALAAKAQEAQGLKSALGETEGKLKDVKGKLAGTEAALEKARAEADARKNVAREVADALKKAGVKADVDGVTGDVTIDFGDHFFESGSSKLKPEMRKILEKALPAYSRSLMDNKVVSQKLSSLEIVGYASPTYKGRYIDPKSVKPEDKRAVDYNLDLSYKRAKSIFEFVFDPAKMSFDHQQQLRPLVKVSGKSFFDSVKGTRNIASMSAQEFCKKYDCKKSQKVLIKFNIDQK